MALRRPAVDEHPLGCRAPLDERPSIVRLAQPLREAMPTRQAPADVPPPGPRADRRPRQRGITRPEPGLTGTAQCMKLLEDACDGVWHWAVGALCDPIITGAYNPHGDFPHAMAPVAVGFTGLAGARTHEAQRLGGHGALHPEASTSIALTRSLEAIISDAPRLGPRTPIDPMMPVALVASHPGRFSGADRSATPRTSRCEELAAARPLWAARAPAAHVRIAHHALGKAQPAGMSGAGRGAALPLRVGADWMAGGLADIPVGVALAMAWTHLGAHGYTPRLGHGG
jgi:hypothetical protein